MHIGTDRLGVDRAIAMRVALVALVPIVLFFVVLALRGMMSARDAVRLAD